MAPTPVLETDFRTYILIAVEDTWAAHVTASINGPQGMHFLPAYSVRTLPWALHNYCNSPFASGMRTFLTQRARRSCRWRYVNRSVKHWTPFTTAHLIIVQCPQAATPGRIATNVCAYLTSCKLGFQNHIRFPIPRGYL